MEPIYVQQVGLGTPRGMLKLGRGAVVAVIAQQQLSEPSHRRVSLGTDESLPWQTQNNKNHKQYQ